MFFIKFLPPPEAAPDRAEFEFDFAVRDCHLAWTLKGLFGIFKKPTNPVSELDSITGP